MEYGEQGGPGRSDSVESLHGTTVRMTITGNLKEEKNHPGNCVVRCCQIRVSDIEFTKDYLKVNGSVTSFIIGVSMNKVRHTLRTMPIELSPTAIATGRLPLELRICFHYVHSLKEYDDILRVMLMVQKKKQRHHDTVLASASIDMDYVLQSGALNDAIVLRSVPSEIRSEKLEKGAPAQPQIEGGIIAVLHSTIWSFPEEIETLDDAQEWDMQDVPMNLTDDEDDSNEEEEISWNPSTVSGVSTSSAANLTSKSSLSQRLWEQRALEAAKKGSQKQKSKLQKLSSLLKSKHKENSDSDVGYNEDHEDDPPYEHGSRATQSAGGDYDLGTSSSSDSDSQNKPSDINDYDDDLENDIAIPTNNVSNTTTNSNPPPVSNPNILRLSPNLIELTPPSSPPNSTRRDTNEPYIKTLEAGVSSPKKQTITGSDSHPSLINFGDTLPSRILLINGLKRRGRRLEECLSRETSGLKSRYTVITTKKSADVAAVMSSIFNKYQQRSDHIVRIGIVGSDSYINDVLRPFVEQLTKKPRGWEPLLFYLLPIGKNNNDIAYHAAAQDPTYHGLFFSPEWQNLFVHHESTRSFSEDECQEIETRISQYMEEGVTSSLKLAIGEALLTYPDSTSKGVPFLKTVHIGSDKETEEPIDSSSSPHLQLDYWIPKKKGPNEDHHEIKSPFNYAVVARLPSVVSVFKADAKLTLNTLGFFVVYKDKSKGRMNALTRHFTKKKDDKEGSKGSGATKKKEEKEITASSITKLVCSVTNDNSVFRVVIDGVDYPGVKFVSVLPQWATHVKYFPIQVFTSGEDVTYAPSAATSQNPTTNQNPSAPIPVPTTPTTLTRPAQNTQGGGNIPAIAVGTAGPISLTTSANFMLPIQATASPKIQPKELPEN